MAANAQVAHTTTIANATVVTDAEIIAVQLGPVASNSYGSNLRLLCNIGITPGADTTNAVLKCYRNVIGGTQVGATVTVPVTSAVAASLFAIFLANEPVGNATYVVAITMTAASANATIGRAALVAIMGN